MGAAAECEGVDLVVAVREHIGHIAGLIHVLLLQGIVVRLETLITYAVSGTESPKDFVLLTFAFQTRKIAPFRDVANPERIAHSLER